MKDVALVWKFSQEHHSCQNVFVAKSIECDALVFLIQLMQVFLFFLRNMKGAKPIPVPNFLSLAVCLVLELHIELCHPLTNIKKFFFFFFTAGGS